MQHGSLGSGCLGSRVDIMRVDGAAVLPVAWGGANRAAASPFSPDRGY